MHAAMESLRRMGLQAVDRCTAVFDVSGVYW